MKDVVAPTASFTRSGSDRIASATLPAIGTVAPAYDATYGSVTQLAGSAQASGSSYSLSYGRDAFTGKLLTQTFNQTDAKGSITTLLNADNTYDALDRRIRRSVDGGQISPTAGGTDYWYGPMLLKPMVVNRAIGDLAGNARVIYIGNEALAIDTLTAAPVRSYPVTDHLGSTRATLGEDGKVQGSLSYDDWGITTVSKQPSAVDDGNMDTLFRFQGIEQELFPLTRLGVVNSEALAWLDAIGQYHYYGREYATGLASFMAMDPAGASVSPYSAFAASPANFIDPDGFVAISWQWYRNQVAMAAIHYLMEMTWTGLAAFAYFFSDLEYGPVAVALWWGIARAGARLLVRAAFGFGGWRISRVMRVNTEVISQLIVEIGEAALMAELLAPSTIPQGTFLANQAGIFTSLVMLSEGVLQVGLLIRLARETFNLLQRENRQIDFQRDLTVYFDPIRPGLWTFMTSSGAAITVRGQMPWNEFVLHRDYDALWQLSRGDLDSGIQYMSVYNMHQLGSAVFAATWRTLGAFSAFFFPFRNMFGYFGNWPPLRAMQYWGTWALHYMTAFEWLNSISVEGPEFVYLEPPTPTFNDALTEEARSLGIRREILQQMYQNQVQDPRVQVPQMNNPLPVVHNPIAPLHRNNHEPSLSETSLMTIVINIEPSGSR